MGKLQRISSKNLTWIDIIHPDKKELDFLASKFKVSQKHINEALPSDHAQRPTVEVQNNYLFIRGLFPVYDRDSRSILSAEVDVFITKDHLITIHDKNILMIDRYFKSLSGSSEVELQLAESSSYMFYELLDYLYHDLFPKLDNINKDIKHIESIILDQSNKQIISEILIVKRNILTFKRIMNSHRSMIRQLLSLESKFFGKSKELQNVYNELLEHVKDIWSLLETYTESIESLENTSNAIVDQKMNNIVKTLTLITAIVMPINVLGALFGMNASHIPFLGSPYDFWKVMLIMLSGSFIVYKLFKKKNWL